jgi:hypothetical protein
MTELDQWTEAVARALCEADGRDPDATVDILGARGAVWTSYFDEARAAVLALAPLVIERCAKIARPCYDKPCDCTDCYCGNTDDAANQAAWIEADGTVARLGALKTAIAEAGRGKEASDD